MAGERHKEKEKWGMNVQNATLVGVKLYIIAPIVIFKKAWGGKHNLLTAGHNKANLDLNSKQLQYNYTLTFYVLYNSSTFFRFTVNPV